MSHVNRQQEPGLLSLFIGMGFKFIGWMLLAWFLLLLIASISVIFVGHELILEYAKQLLQSEMNFLNNKNTWFINQPGHTAEQLSQTIQSALWNKTHLVNGLDWLKQQQDSPNKLFSQATQRMLPFLVDYMHILITVTQITVIRFFTIFLALPLFWLLGLIGFVDGLVHRTLRRLQGSRESALIYHKARNAVVPSFIGGCFLYLMLPTHLPASWLLLPFAFLFAVSLSITTRMFKKYL